MNEIPRDCLSCGHSMSADREDGTMCLVCSLKGFCETEENSICDDYN